MSLDNMEQNRIADMFHGRAVFLSGGTGFLGKLFIEKLLRSCPTIKTIYLLLREKRGKDPHQRINDIFSNVVFDKLKQQQPLAIKKCVVISGDITIPNLGISAEQRELLRNNVEFIIHSAASTRFDDSVKIATQMNTRGTLYMLQLAKECKKLKCFVHISTAYAYPKEKLLYEKSYKPPAKPQDILDAIDFDRREGESVAEWDESVHLALLKDCPNTYTFTKAMAEAVVVEAMDSIPAIIARPSVVCPTFCEPFPGWCNNLQGPMGLFVGAGKGIIRTMYMKGDTYADFIPADVCVNGILACMWNFVEMDPQQRIYHVTSSSDYTYNWKEIIEMGKDIIYNHVPFNGVVWYPGGSLKTNKTVHLICFYLFQIVPAILIDALLFVLGYKPILLQIQRRIQKGSDMFEYYTTRPWNFSNEQTLKVIERMNQLEKDTFPIIPKELNVKNYLIECIMSVRRNNLKETDDMLPAARRHMKVMWVVDKLTIIMFIGLIVYYLYKWFC